MHVMGPLFDAVPQLIKSFAPEQNGRHSTDVIFRCIFVNNFFYYELT